MIVKCFLSVIVGLNLLAISPVFGQSNDPKRYNVLFIALDDLKPDLGCYGNEQVVTPNFDKLASQSTVFMNTQCQQAVCGPSRASLMTGLRPDKTQVWDLQTLIRSANPDVIMLPEALKAKGYFTLGVGKIYDPRSVDKQSDERSWSETFKKKYKLAQGFEDLAFETYHSPQIKSRVKEMDNIWGENAKNDIKVSTESMDVPDDAYLDGAMTNYVVNRLKDLKKQDKPFFFAVGYKKPHLPFVAPKKYWDLYDREKIQLAEWQKKSIDGPEIAYHNAGELRSYSDIEDSNTEQSKNGLLSLSLDKQRELIHGYMACISYVDAQVGRLMDALKANGLDKNTIVVIWGDHGWHLGDHSLWCKHSNFEQATRVPLIIKVPGVTQGNKYTHPTEFVDIYPTLMELTGNKVPTYLDGASLVPALKDNLVKVKEFAISQYPRGGGKGARETMGYSLRNDRYRYTEWVGHHFNTAKQFNPTMIKDMELYDYQVDPLETRNLAKDPLMKKIVQQLQQQLHQYYQQQFKTAGNTR